MTARILVTGSRAWDDVPRLAFFLGEAVGALSLQGDVVVVHGHCPTGADRIADQLCHRYDIPVERHPAQWQRFGRRAGFLRNDEMVKLGAAVCLAFIKDGSAGASMCADLAEGARITTIRFTA